jgi:hypothetical protein
VAVVEQLFEAGETFHSCGCSGPGHRPRDPGALRSFLTERRTEYLQHLQAWMTATSTTANQAAERERAIASWKHRLAKIDAVLACT